MVFTREQVFLHSRARHQFFHSMTTGVDRDGKLVFLDHEALLDDLRDIVGWNGNIGRFRFLLNTGIAWCDIDMCDFWLVGNFPC